MSDHERPGLNWDRDDSWNRDKRARERWPRFATEVPPEIAEQLDELCKVIARRNTLTHYSRAALVRNALRAYLNAEMPEPEPPIDSTAVEEPEELPA